EVVSPTSVMSANASDEPSRPASASASLLPFICPPVARAALRSRRAVDIGCADTVTSAGIEVGARARQPKVLCVFRDAHESGGTLGRIHEIVRVRVIANLHLGTVARADVVSCISPRRRY